MTELLTDAQVAKGLHMHVRTLRRKIKANKIALNYVPQGRKMLFRPEAVEEYLLSLEVIRDGSGYTLEKTARTLRMEGFEFVERFEEFGAMSDAKARKFFKRFRKAA
jgi:excisionase family DNA binding protein